ncbi:hypothetical protein C5706_32945, partial [Klebsiella pneumoniae]
AVSGYAGCSRIFGTSKKAVERIRMNISAREDSRRDHDQLIDRIRGIWIRRLQSDIRDLEKSR